MDWDSDDNIAIGGTSSDLAVTGSAFFPLGFIVYVTNNAVLGWTKVFPFGYRSVDAISFMSTTKLAVCVTTGISITTHTAFLTFDSAGSLLYSY